MFPATHAQTVLTYLFVLFLKKHILGVDMSRDFRHKPGKRTAARLCAALFSIAHCGAACAQAVVDAGGGGGNSAAGASK